MMFNTLQRRDLNKKGGIEKVRNEVNKTEGIFVEEGEVLVPVYVDTLGMDVLRG